MTELYDTLADNSWRCPTDDGSADLFVTELGSGPAVLVLHGGPGISHGYLVDAVRRVTDHARFVLFDQRGSLLSPLSDTAIADLTVEQMVADIETLRTALDLETVTLLGHSWGSVLAQEYYRTHPERVDRMILTGAMPPHSPPESWLPEVFARQEEMRNRPEVRIALEAAGLGDTETLTPRLRALKYRMTGWASFTMYRLADWRRARPAHLNAAAGERLGDFILSGYDIRSVLRSHPVPIQVIQGDHDYVDPEARWWSSLANEWSTVRVDVLARAGHNSWCDDAAAFDRALTAALNRS